MITMIIRQYRDSDREAIKELHRVALKATGAFDESGKWDEDLDNIAKVYLESGDFFVGVIEDRIIAMGAVKKIGDQVGEIKRMRVHPDFQGQGFGQMMLERLEQRAKVLGYKVLQLDTTMKQRVAQKLYEKNGYHEVRREIEGWPMEMIFYSKKLS